ncbi:hypothetical protein L249_0205, partial [Ophiocordyceps polyrhachis-furcata BCC 54312]
GGVARRNSNSSSTVHQPPIAAKPPPSYEEAAGPHPPPPGRPPQPSTSTLTLTSTSDPSTHDWQTAVPDTSLFPAPPTYFGAHERSPASNADEADAEAGDAWCRYYPLAEPLSMAVVPTEHVQLLMPFEFHGSIREFRDGGGGRWRVTTDVRSPDRCIIGYPPLYLAGKKQDAAKKTTKSTTTTIYYEARLLPTSRNISLALGFTALPYPSFRMPGWHRGSLAIHGDDGRRYVNDSYGGKDFTTAFRRGATYGVGLVINHLDRGSSSVFFTCDGGVVGRWLLFEETDAEDDSAVVGLEGMHDVCCAVGTFDALDFELVFDSERWLYREGLIQTDRKRKALARLAMSGALEGASWPSLRDYILRLLDKIAHTDFPASKSARLQVTMYGNESPSSSMQAHDEDSSSTLDATDADEEGGREGKKANDDDDDDDDSDQKDGEGSSSSPTTTLPRQVVAQLDAIKAQLRHFSSNPPHTIQRLAELLLNPVLQYRALASYLHAVDRVVNVTSGTDVYPLPLPLVPDLSAGGRDVNNDGHHHNHQAAAVSWGNSTTTEGTQTIDGPNGMGRIETVSVSVNGVPSTGHARGVTQGELLRQEQRAGVIPVSQLSRGRNGAVVSATTAHIDHVGDDDKDVVIDDDNDDDDDDDDDVNDSIPHLRGPDHVGVSDTGPQSSTITGQGGVQMHNIDVEAAVGKRSAASGRDGSKLDDDSPSTLDDETTFGTKREADIPLETDAPKRAKETVDDDDDDDDASASPPLTTTAVTDEKMEET